MVQRHFDIPAEIEYTSSSLGKVRVRANTGMAVVIPAQEILVVLHGEQADAERRQTAARSVAQEDDGSGGATG